MASDPDDPDGRSVFRQRAEIADVRGHHSTVRLGGGHNERIHG